MLILEIIGGRRRGGGVGGVHCRMTCQLEVGWMETCPRSALSCLRTSQQLQPVDPVLTTTDGEGYVFESLLLCIPRVMNTLTFHADAAGDRRR